MYCPQCGTDSTSNVQYCRACGANLKVIGKAVALSEAIARSDRGPLPKIREMVKGLKVEQVTDEVSKALERMNHEIANISPEKKSLHDRKPWISFGKKKTPQERREEKITKGVVSLFSGVGLTLFLYYLSTALILKLPPHIVGQIPFELDPVVRMIWLFGAIPTLSGVGNIVAGLLIRPQQHQLPYPEQQQYIQPEFPAPSPTPQANATSAITSVPGSVTEHTTELLEEKSVQ